MYFFKSSDEDGNTIGSEDESVSETLEQSENEDGAKPDEELPAGSSLIADVSDEIHAKEEGRKRKKTTRNQKNEDQENDIDNIGFSFDDADTSDEEVNKNLFFPFMLQRAKM